MAQYTFDIYTGKMRLYVRERVREKKSFWRKWRAASVALSIIADNALIVTWKGNAAQVSTEFKVTLAKKRCCGFSENCGKKKMLKCNTFFFINLGWTTLHSLLLRNQDAFKQIILSELARHPPNVREQEITGSRMIQKRRFRLNGTAIWRWQVNETRTGHSSVRPDES